MVGAATRGAVGWVATLVRVLGLLIAAILVIHILYTVFVVNPVNAVAKFVRTARTPFRWDWPACLLRLIRSLRWERTTASRR